MKTLAAVIGLTFATAACAGATRASLKQKAPMPNLTTPSSVGANAGTAIGPRVASATTTKLKARGELKEQLIVEGWVSMEATEVPETVRAIRKQVVALGGRVVNEQLSGARTSWRANLRVRLPPSGMTSFVTWLGTHGTITSKSIKGTDVSRQLFDQKIALENLTQTMHRLRKLLETPGLKMTSILAIEQQLTRLRGQIEAIKGNRRWLKDRVQHATLAISLTRKEGAILDPQVKFYPGGRFSTLVMLDSSSVLQRTRYGGGLSIYTFPEPKNKNAPRITIDLDMFQDADGRGRGFLATMGSAIYSDFLGSGKRRFLNPYLGMRMGYGYINESSFVLGAGGGIELFKHKRVMVDASVSGNAFIRDNVKLGVVGSLGAVFAF